jgi:hypothetical protein
VSVDRRHTVKILDRRLLVKPLDIKIVPRLEAGMAADDPTSANLAHVLEVASGTLDKEFQRANRWDEKARGQATLAGSWFAVTQAVAVVALGSSAPDGWVIGLAVGLVGQAGALVMNLIRVADVWKPREREEVAENTLQDLKGRVQDPSADFAAAMIDFYIPVLDEAQKANEERGKAFEKASFWWWFVLGLGLAEIAAALISQAR